MTEIDMLLLEKQLKKERLKKLLKSKDTLISLGVTGANIASAIINVNEFTQAFSVLIILLESKIIKKQWEATTGYEEQKIREFIKETKDYQELKIGYEEYIKKVASLLKKFNFPSSKDAIMYLQCLLTGGCFSIHNQHEYKNFKYEKPDLANLCGARVSTGKTVCRHQSAFLSDVLNNLGYTSANMTVMTTTTNPIQLAKSRNKVWNHSVVGVYEKGHMYLFDPTCGRFITKSTLESSEKESILISEYVMPEKRYLILNPNKNAINVHTEKAFDKIVAAPPMTITNGEAEFLLNKAATIYNGNTKDQEQFITETTESREQIANLYTKLVPHSDEPIKKWLVIK